MNCICVRRFAVGLLAFACVAGGARGQGTAGRNLTWAQALRQGDAWHAGDEALRIGGQVLLYQHEDGGWPKNTDFAAPLDAAARAALAEKKGENSESTIDNGGTVEPLRFLAPLARGKAGPAADAATSATAFRAAFLKGIDFLLDAQYTNGGWPQFPHRTSGYWIHITYNDNAMINVLNLLREIGDIDPRFDFVDEARRERARKAVAKGIECILATQVRVGGKLTVWCAQNDEKTLAPAPARAYELVSLSGSESVGIVRFLMGIEKPTPEEIAAIESAMAWFERSRIEGIRVQNAMTDGKPDRVVVADPSAPPVWARFYEIETNKPFFCGRDGIKKQTLAEIEQERRGGYAWYGNWPAQLLAKDYPDWKSKHAAEGRP